MAPNRGRRGRDTCLGVGPMLGVDGQHGHVGPSTKEVTETDFAPQGTLGPGVAPEDRDSLSEFIWVVGEHGSGLRSELKDGQKKGSLRPCPDGAPDHLPLHDNRFEIIVYVDQEAAMAVTGMKFSVDAVSSAAAVGLVDSVRKNNFQLMERLLRINPSLIDLESESFHYRHTPLTMAASYNRLDMLHLLLEQGARTEVSSHHGTALLQASKLGYLDVVEALLDNAADVTLTERGTGYNALMTACAYGKTAVARQLLSHGAYLTIDQRGRHEGHTALWYAASAGNREMVKLLLRDGGASTGVKDSHGRTAAELAKEYGHHEVADIISGWSEAFVRPYLLTRLWTLHNAATSHRVLTTQPTSNATHHAPPPLNARITQGMPLPLVEVLDAQAAEEGEGRGRRRRGRGEEQGREALVEVLRYVTIDLSTELFTEFMLFFPPRP